MPMSWTPENDNILFLKVLETNNVSVNYHAIAEAWPTEAGKEKPTARAISERIFRLKQKAKQRVSISTPSTPSGKTATPRAPRGSARGGGRRGGGSASVSVKRKKALTPDSDGETETEKTPTATTKRVKRELQDDVTMNELKDLELSTPSKRSRKPVQYLNMAAYTDSDNNANDSEDSFDADFNPDEVPTFYAEKKYHHAIIADMTDGVDA